VEGAVDLDDDGEEGWREGGKEGEKKEIQSGIR